MGIFLNGTMSFDAYKAVASGKFFVDKTEMLNEIIPEIGMSERFFVLRDQGVLGKVLWQI